MKQYKTMAVRGATTLPENTKQEITDGVIELIDKIIAENSLDQEDIISAIFTMTEDLDAEFPAKAARLHFGWNDVPMVCAREIPVPNSMPLCVRVLIHINTLMEKKDIKHVYLHNAVNLRPDISNTGR